MDDDSVAGRLILQGKLNLKTPLIIGSGQNDLSDIEVLKDEDGRPFIPATSFVGVLRHYFEEKINCPNRDKIQADYFWGSKEADGVQSALICRDLRTEDAMIKIRDGVAIEPKRGIAKEKGKYDYEVVEPCASFNLHMEVILRNVFDKDIFERIIATLIEPLKKGKISLGAKTANGFGRCVLEEIKYCEFDYSKRQDVIRWLKQDFNKLKNLDTKPYDVTDKTFSIDAIFSIKSSVIIKSYPSNTDMPSDAVHITSNDKNVLPGTSIKGAIRNRALKMLKTFDATDAADRRIDHLFGVVDVDKKSKIKSRVYIEETEIKNVKTELQNRIRIDRFTGGTIKTALFDSMPLWDSKDDSAVNIKMTITNYKEREAGLLLLILKDLWNGDLPIGGEKNIGRGILKGVLARIRWDGKEVTIEEKNNRLLISNNELAKELNDFSRLVSNSASEEKEVIHA